MIRIHWPRVCGLILCPAFCWGLIILAIVAASGCGKDRERTQAAADAVAGVDAMALAAPSVRPIAAGTVDHVLATRGLERRDQLPAPQMQPQAITADAAAYQRQGQAAIQASLSPGWLAGMAAAAIAALGIAGRIGLLGPIGGWLAASITPAREAAQQARNGNLAGAALTMMAQIETAPADIAQPIKQAISKHLTPEQEAEVRRVLQEMSSNESTPTA